MSPQEVQAGGDTLAELRAQTLRLAGDLPGALRRLSVRSLDVVIEVEWQDAGAAPVTLVQAAPANGHQVAAEDTADSLESIAVTSPMVGTVYHAPSPDQPPFVSVGDLVEPGQTVAIVEAMKLFNPIVSEVAGVVTEVLVANGEAVEFGQPLLRLKSSADDDIDAGLAGADVR